MSCHASSDSNRPIHRHHRPPRSPYDAVARRMANTRLSATVGSMPAGSAAATVDAAAQIQLPIAFGERPLLVLFMLPIIVCALLGGLLPGLLSTLVTALITTYYVLPPLHQLAIGMGQDLVQWGS